VKTASGPLTTLINSGSFDAFEVYTIALSGGSSVFLSSAPFAITDGTSTWPANGPLITEDANQRGHWKVGTDVDSWVLSVAPRAIDPITGAANPDKIGTQPFLGACRAGVLDGGDVTIKRAYFDPTTFTYPPAIAGATAVGYLTIFRGLIADIALNTNLATITVNDYRQLLTTQMPRNIYQPACEWTLYAFGCKLSAAAFAKPGTVASVTSRSELNVTVAAPAGSGDYKLGRMTFTSGANNGMTRTIQDWNGAAHFQVQPPFPYNIAAGDTANLYPGCDKTLADCTLFNNTINFGGDPFIPKPTVSGV
jgi:hypothetical protein